MAKKRISELTLGECRKICLNKNIQDNKCKNCPFDRKNYCLLILCNNCQKKFEDELDKEIEVE